MDANKMREEFETQFVEEYVRVLGEGARELAAHALAANSPVVSMSWWAWQASRAAVVVELPQVVAYEAGYDSIRDNEYAGLPDRLPDFDYDELFKLHRSDEVREAIEAQGLRVKP